jgi:hypothetical protein
MSPKAIQWLGDCGLEGTINEVHDKLDAGSTPPVVSTSVPLTNGLLLALHCSARLHAKHPSVRLHALLVALGYVAADAKDSRSRDLWAKHAPKLYLDVVRNNRKLHGYGKLQTVDFLLLEVKTAATTAQERETVSAGSVRAW